MMTGGGRRPTGEALNFFSKYKKFAYGRDGDRNKIINRLLALNDVDTVIVGIGGLGKIVVWKNIYWF